MSGENYSNATLYNETSHVPASYEQKVAVTAVIAVFGVWCTIGNTITILAITMHRHMRTKTNAFILSLAVSDLLSTLIASPLWLYRRTWGFSTWELGDLMCKLYWFTDEMTSYCTAMHIASFAIWRYILIRWPHKMVTMRTIHIWIATMWTLALIFGGFVYCSFYAPRKKTPDDPVSYNWPMCSIEILNHGTEKLGRYYMFSASTFILLPMAILIATSAMIGRELICGKAIKNRQRKVKEKKAVAQLAMIATCFLIGYIPMTTYMLWTNHSKIKDFEIDYWTGIAAYFCLRLSECMNPVAYNAASNKMRKASKNVIKHLCSCRKIPLTKSSNASSRMLT